MSWVRSVTKREEKSTERRGGRELYSLELILYGTSSCPLFGIPLGGHREGCNVGVNVRSDLISVSVSLVVLRGAETSALR